MGSHERSFSLIVQRPCKTIIRVMKLPIERPRTPMKALPKVCARVPKCRRLRPIVLMLWTGLEECSSVPVKATMMNVNNEECSGWMQAMFT